MILFIAATIFTLLKLCGDVAALGWRDLFINFGNSRIEESSFSSLSIRYLDHNGGFVVSADDVRQNGNRMCNLQDIDGHIMKIPFICFQIVLFMRLEGTPSGARHIPFRIIFAPVFLIQGAGVLFAAYRLIEKIVLLLHSGAAFGRCLTVASKAGDLLGFLHHGPRLLGWWSIDGRSREELARLDCAEASGSGDYKVYFVNKLKSQSLAARVWKTSKCMV